jgi:uncharacterized protein YutE (UPF0331/DUF86 family)
MNIDERLEALTHSVELIASMQLKTEKELNRLGRYVRVVAEMVLDHEARLRAIDGEDENDEGTKDAQ